MQTPTLKVSVVALLLAAAAIAQAPDQEHIANNVFAQMRWRELGPTGCGGRIVDIAVHPQNTAVFWVAAASGGLWKTTNGGITFAPQFQDQYSISIGDIAVAPSNGDVLYVGTGESNNQRSSYWGDGVYKSTDGGKTFTHVGLNGTDHIGRIAVHPTDADTVFVAALGALYSSNDERGLYRSKDGGKSWQRVQHLGAGVGFVDVLIDPAEPNVVYAASYERSRRAWHFTEGGEGSRLWRSKDGGDNWERLGGGLPTGVLGRIGIDLCLADPKVVYATIENLNPLTTPATEPDTSSSSDPREGGADPKAAIALADAETLADPLAAAEFAAAVAAAQDPVRQARRRTIGGEVWRSDDQGATWRKQNGRTPIGGNPGYYYGQIRVDPQNANTVYVLLVPVHRSTDGGKTWTPGSGGAGGPGGGGRGRGGAGAAFADTLHSDHHALWIDPRDGRHCILGNDGGLAITHDGGRTWDHVNRLPITQFYAIGVDLRDPYRIYGGLQDNGTWGFPVRGATSSGIRIADAYRIDGGDGFYVCCDPTDPDIVYSESQFGGMSRQNLRTGVRKSIKPQAQKGEQPLRFNWMTPIVLSPHNPHTVYVGTQFVHRSRDRGDTWTTISDDLTTNDAQKKAGNVPHCTITTIAESPRREGMLWVGTDDGRVWLSKDGGQRWTELSDRFPASVRGLWVSRVECSGHDAATAFVAFTGYREDRRAPYLFRTDDGGDTFKPIAHDLPMEPINVVRQHPRNEAVLLVGTEMGAYVSLDHGAHWHRFGSNLPRVAVHDLVVHPRESHVIVGTHGRGIWVLDAAALEQINAAALAKPFHVFPPSDGVLLRRAFSAGNTGARNWTAANPFTAPVFRYMLAQTEERKVKIEVLDATGRVLWSHDGSGEAGYHEVPWQATPGRGGFGGQGGARGGQGGGGVRAGQFAVRISLGDQQVVQAFSVRDLRGTQSLLGSVPGLGSMPDDEASDEVETAGAAGSGR